MPTNDKLLDIKVRCRVCRTPYALSVPLEGYLDWKYEGVKTQNAMPDVTPEDRELLISQICPKCWTNLFKGR